MTPSITRTFWPKQAGLATVELALVLPVVLFLLFATAEIGRAFIQHDTLTKAVRDGARYLASNARSGTGATMNTAAFTEAENRVVCGRLNCGSNERFLPGLDTTDVSAQIVDADHVEITARYTYLPIFGTILRALGFGRDVSIGFDLTATSSMRIL